MPWLVRLIALFYFAAATTAVAESRSNLFDLEERQPIRLGLDLRNFTVFQDGYDNSSFGDELEVFDNLLLRAKADIQIHDELTAEIHMLQTSTLQTSDQQVDFAGFSLSGNTRSFVIDDLNVRIVEEGRFQWDLFPDRLLVAWSRKRYDLRVGRQPVTFSRTFFWSPIDWIAPFTQNTLDRAYKPGVDGVRFDWWLSSLTSFSLLYAFGDDAKWDNSALVGKYTVNLGAWDVDLLSGRVREQLRFGYGFSGTPDFLAGAALRGEGSLYVSEEDTSDNFFRGTLGYQYQFPSSLQFVFEYYYNGFGEDDTIDYATVLAEPLFLNGEITNLGRHLLGANSSYELTALLKGDLGLIFNLLDGSFLLIPTLVYSLADEIDINGGASIAIGDKPRGNILRSEFGTYPSYYYIELVVIF